MNNEKIDKIKRKVSKLMALANGTSNEHEANSAMIKAAKLMASYHVSEGDLNASNIIIAKKSFTNGRFMAKISDKILMQGICTSMGVFCLYTTATKAVYNHRTEKFNEGTPCVFTLTGNECDIEIAWYMFESCLNQVSDLAKTYRAINKLGGAATNDYSTGLVSGIVGRFKQMAKADIPEGTGLVPVDTRQQQARDHYDTNSGRGYKSNSVSVRNNNHMKQGGDDSHQVRFNAGVNGAKTTSTSTKRLH